MSRITKFQAEGDGKDPNSRKKFRYLGESSWILRQDIRQNTQCTDDFFPDERHAIRKKNNSDDAKGSTAEYEDNFLSIVRIFEFPWINIGALK